VRRPLRGFTLIEVLVALVIVTLGMSAVLGSMMSAANTASYLRDKTFAQWVALNQIAQVRLKAQPPDKGKTTGESDMAGRKWSWEQNVQPVENVPGVLKIDVSVRPAEIAESKKGSWYATESGALGSAVDYQFDNALEWDALQIKVQMQPPGGSNNNKGTNNSTNNGTNNNSNNKGNTPGGGQ